MALTKEELKALSDLLDEKLDKRLAPIEKKLDKIEGRLDAIETRLDKVEGRLDAMETRLDKVEGRLDAMEIRLEKVEGRLDRLETDVAAVKKGLTEVRGAQIKIDRRISDIYNLALDAWGQGVENRAWLQRMTK
nr:hypothetical protein [uncultured Acetatifactor sp.]